MVMVKDPETGLLEYVKKPQDITVVTDGGPWASHNMPCPVCQDNHAVLNLNEGIFGPCRKCEKEGWEIIKHLSLWQRINNLLRE